MLDHASFRALLADRLAGLGDATAVELHLHGGEAFFLRCVRKICEAYAICEIIPIHEGIDGARASSHLKPHEAAVPYATIADLVISSHDLVSGHPAGFVGTP